MDKKAVCGVVGLGVLVVAAGVVTTLIVKNKKDKKDCRVAAN